MSHQDAEVAGGVDPSSILGCGCVFRGSLLGLRFRATVVAYGSCEARMLRHPFWACASKAIAAAVTHECKQREIVGVQFV